MAQCRQCGRKGVFLSVDRYGLCRACAERAAIEIEQRGRIITESLQLVKQGKTLKTRLSRLDLLRQHADALKKYEVLGIPTLSLLPSKILTEYPGWRDEVLLEEAEKTMRTAVAKA